MVEVAERHRRRQDSHRSVRLAPHERLERFGQERDRGAVVGEAEELHRRTRAHRLRRRGVLTQVAQDVERHLRDLARAAIADVERVDLGTRQSQLAQEVGPRREAAALDDVLLGVARQRDAAALVEAFEQDAHLERREVLHLVDGDVTVAELRVAAAGERSDAKLPGAQQQRQVLGVDLRLRSPARRESRP